MKPLPHHRTCWLLAAALAAGCALGPELPPPQPPETADYLPGPPPGGAAMPALVLQPIPADWWAVFGSPELDALVRQAMADNPTLQQARARLVQARELRTARAGVIELPQVDASFGASRQRIDPATVGFPQAPVPSPFNVFSLGANVAYDFDLFGGAKKELEALDAELDFQAYELDAARLTLQGEVVAGAIRLAAAEAQIEALRSMLELQRSRLQINEQRLELGAVSALDLQNQRAELARAEAALPPLLAQRELARHLLAVLCGQAPALAALPPAKLSQLRMPGELPMRPPAEMVKHRPDVRAGEALLRKAGAEVGVATANLYPKLVISGGFSTSQLELSQLFGNGINVWNIGANLVQPLFRGGELKARKRAAEAAYEQALAGYRQVVLQAMQNVADVMRALEADAHSVTLRDEQLARAGAALQISSGRYEAGALSRLMLLEVELAQQQAGLDRLQAQAARLADAAALYRALGGGAAELTAAARGR